MGEGSVVATTYFGMLWYPLLEIAPSSNVVAKFRAPCI